MQMTMLVAYDIEVDEQ